MLDWDTLDTINCTYRNVLRIIDYINDVHHDTQDVIKVVEPMSEKINRLENNLNAIDQLKDVFDQIQQIEIKVKDLEYKQNVIDDNVRRIGQVLNIECKPKSIGCVVIGTRK